ncbi:hypothetical protein [uncultured Bacteroides sp.]|uniref:hypothetical protein n=1 Tax=uncultured Bacteroides sp. TaxID=162156 RepID=UPI0026745CD0|nr:hypothetical protein [uncultured Bacteroides sp.]
MIMRLLTMLVISVMVSGYYFPFAFAFAPTVNTKMILAVTGILLVLYKGCREYQITISKEFMGTVGLAFLFSLACFIAIDYNHTDDYSYVTYFVSFFTWLGGAYTVCAAIRTLHGKATLKILVGYLSFVCMVQCVLSLLIDRIPVFQVWVDFHISQGQEFFQEVNRLYGIGAALDPAGVRFAIVLILIACLLCEDRNLRQDRKKIIAFLFCFFLISGLGNMMSRTTSVGMLIGIAYIICSTGIFRLILRTCDFKFYAVFGGLLAIFTVLGIYLYQTDASFHQDIRFAFEGFFNWAETGEWKTGSTDKLNREMWIWPENVKTWLIGSGLFGNYVYSTDIGYCRFILYCGLTGFSFFIAFFIYNAWVFARKFPTFRLMSLVLLALSFIVWIKVATDIFLIYALFYCLDEEEELPSVVTV